MTVRDKWLLGVTITLTGLAIFLPAGGMFWLLNALPLLMIVYFTYASSSFRRFFSVGPVIIVIIVLALGGGILLWGLLAVIYWIALVGLILALFPTALNILATYFCVRYLPTSKSWKFALAVPISILLGLNFRLPAIHEMLRPDLASDTVIKRQLVLSPDDALSVESDVKEWKLRPWVFDTATIRANAVPNVWWDGPKMLVEGVEQSLLDSQVPFKTGGDSRKRLVIHSREEGNHLIFDAAILENGETIAHTHSRKRVRFLLENTDSGKRSLSDPLMRVSYLLYGNVWNILLNLLDHMSDQDAAIYEGITKYRLLRPFIEKAVVFDKSRQSHQHYELKVLVDPFSALNQDVQYLCQYTFGGGQSDRTFHFSNGNRFTISRNSMDYIEFETQDGAKKRIPNTVGFYITRVLCQKDRAVILGREQADNRLDKGVKVAWLNSRGAQLADGVINLPTYDTEIYREVGSAGLKGDCLLLNIRVQQGRYQDSRGKRENVGYQACPLVSPRRQETSSTSRPSQT